jgi:hypothetical protein
LIFTALLRKIVDNAVTATVFSLALDVVDFQLEGLFILEGADSFTLTKDEADVV